MSNQVKALGLVRKIDPLGRVVIPKETRRILGMEEGTPIEFFADGDSVILRKYAAACCVCGGIGDTEVNEVSICNKCISKIKEL